MNATTRPFLVTGVVLAAIVLAACGDGPSQLQTSREPNPGPQHDATKFWDATASTRWNARALTLVGLQPPANGQAATSRILTYLSLAQYRAVLAAEKGNSQSTHPSVPAAVSSASAAVLSDFFPGFVTTIQGWLTADLAAPGWPGAQQQDVASGQATGQAIANAVLALKASDNYLLASAPTPPVGDGYWYSAPNTAIVRSLYGTRPFFLKSSDQLRPPPPPAFGSPEYLAARAEVRLISDTRTPEQIAIAQSYATATAPFTAGSQNLMADELIRDHHRTEHEAARILAYANAAAFDAQIACWDAKFTYWLIRPSQADKFITTVVALPNHPSYPSAHACITSAIMNVLIDAFPSERDRLQGFIRISGLSRIYAGLHYRFDVEAGETIGARAAALARAGSLE
jgi:membrane-associated phospholipid phosphatase